MRIEGVDHVGIAAPSREFVEEWIRKLGLRIAREEVVADQQVLTLFVDLPNLKLEFVVPTSPDSLVSKHLEKRGPGLHHLAFKVPMCEEAIGAATDAGITALDPKPRPGVEGSRIAFLHPRDTGQVLVELVELRPQRPR